jgi:hypothetical protein
LKHFLCISILLLSWPLHVRAEQGINLEPPLRLASDNSTLFQSYLEGEAELSDLHSPYIYINAGFSHLGRITSVSSETVENYCLQSISGSGFFIGAEAEVKKNLFDHIFLSGQSIGRLDMLTLGYEFRYYAGGKKVMLAPWLGLGATFNEVKAYPLDPSDNDPETEGYGFGLTLSGGLQLKITRAVHLYYGYRANSATVLGFKSGASGYTNSFGGSFNVVHNFLSLTIRFDDQSGAVEGG